MDHAFRKKRSNPAVQPLIQLLHRQIDHLADLDRQGETRCDQRLDAVSDLSILGDGLQFGDDLLHESASDRHHFADEPEVPA